MPPLIRLYIRSIAIGFVLACVFTGLLIGLDVAHLRHLVLSSPLGWLAVMMLVIFNGIVFSGVQFGFAIMRMGQPRPRDGGGRKSAPARMIAAAIAIPGSRRR